MTTNDYNSLQPIFLELFILPPDPIRQFSQNTSLVCHIIGTCNNLTWNGPALLNNNRGRVTIMQNGSHSELTIRSLLVQDEGQYSCRCGEESAISTLTVLSKSFLVSGSGRAIGSKSKVMGTC